MRYINFCPVCGASPLCTIKKRVNLNKTEGMLRGQYLEYSMKLCGERIPNEYLSICGKCAAIYRSSPFTENEIKAMYTSLYLDFENKFQTEIIYNDEKILKACSELIYEKVRGIERIYSVCVKDVFDIGGRDGFRLVKLADNGYNCTVYDPIAIKSCNDKIYKKYIWSNELKKGENADLIILCNVLEHCIDPRKVIDDCYAHLNENGFLFIEIPVDFETSLDWLLLYQFFKRPLGIDVTHQVFFSKRAIERLLNNGKFIIKKINYNTFPFCGVRIMEILARKIPARQAGSDKEKKISGSSLLFLLISLAGIFPRLVLKISNKCCLKFMGY